LVLERLRFGFSLIVNRLVVLFFSPLSPLHRLVQQIGPEKKGVKINYR